MKKLIVAVCAFGIACVAWSGVAAPVQDGVSTLAGDTVSTPIDWP